MDDGDDCGPIERANEFGSGGGGGGGARPRTSEAAAWRGLYPPVAGGCGCHGR